MRLLRRIWKRFCDYVDAQAPRTREELDDWRHK